ncbi:MAG: LysM peptidoglycan-binding domain-containing protein [Acidimicrobiales bacterium]
MHIRLLVPVVVVFAAFFSLGGLGLSATAAGATTGSGTSSSGQRIHIVQPGDTVQSIARKYGVSADDIRVANGIVDDKVYAGAGLKIDSGASSDRSSGTTPVTRISSISKGTVPTGPSVYTVKAGDYLLHIARLHGVTLSTVLKANGLKTTSLIMPGDRLTIPARSTASAPSADPASSSSSTGGPSRSAGLAGWPSLRCPVPGATFMNDWGFPRDGGTRFHQGNDLFAPKGTTIYAPATGTIAYSSNTLGGSSFNLVTASGWELYGAHLSATIGTNRYVRAGEPIGRVGNTGDAAGGPSHLHLGLRRVNGAPTNPYPSLVAACR